MAAATLPPHHRPSGSREPGRPPSCVERARRGAHAALLFVLASTLTLSIARVGHAQLGLESPALERLPLPERAAPRESVLPAPPRPQSPAAEAGPGATPEDRSGPTPSILVERFVVVGASAFSEATLADALSPWTGRPISPEGLADARRAITRLYVDAGYVNSGARLPDQSVRGGVVRLDVVEGSLDEILIAAPSHYRPAYLEQWLRARVSQPLNLSQLEEALRVLQNDERIERVDAQLNPGTERGAARLTLAVKESSRFALDLRTNNYRPPAVGSYAGSAFVRDRHPLGLGDELDLSAEFAEGLIRGEGRYAIPIGAYGTRVGVRVRYTESEVVGALESVGIENEALSVGLTLEQTLYESPRQRLGVSLIGEWRTALSFIDGERVSLSRGAVRGRSTVSVARLQAEWSYRDLAQVAVARTTMSFGTDLFDATMSGTSLPDGEFFTWLTQMQWARRLPWAGVETLARFDLQLANDPLLSLEQFAVGGRYSVRGYAENRFVRDQGAILSLETRIPIWRNGSGSRFVQFVPFFDAAHSWTYGRNTDGRQWISSVGFGLRGRLWGELFAEAYWAHAIQDVENFEDGPQARGFSFGLSWRLD